MDVLLASVFTFVNEFLAAAIVIVAASILLYNLTLNLDNQVARTSSIVLGSVTMTFICDVFISLGPSAGTYASTLRLQWLGIAFMPAALFHLSDALLATTGLPSRGRRRRVITLLYITGIVFLVLAAFSDLLITPVRVQPELLEQGVYISLRPGPLFPVYVFFFVFFSAFAFYNVQRARQRCRTRDTRRRMGYLQFAMLTPAIGIFPFSTLLGAGQEYSLTGLALVNLTNIIVIFMLLFLAYPLSFFGSRIPDRAVKTELLRFVLRGPATGVFALITILLTSSAARIFSLPGETFAPFAVVAVVLFWQWLVYLALPLLERYLVYADNNSDYDQFAKLQELSERLLTRSDLLQLLDVTLASTCDYLRVNTAFVASVNDDGIPELVSAVGPARPDNQLLADDAQVVLAMFHPTEPTEEYAITRWHGYWIAPLYGTRLRADGSRLIGFLGVQARAVEIDLIPDENENLARFCQRAAQTLDDIHLQAEIFAALEGLLPQVSMTRRVAAAIEFKPGTAPAQSAQIAVDNGLLIDTAQFNEQVKAALRHYWGGEGLTRSRLLELRIVKEALPANENNATRALRSVIKEAIERQKPTSSDRKLYSPEWTIYNILDWRFVEREKVRDVAKKLALSEPTFYRRQDDAVAAVAATLLDMERSAGRSRTSGAAIQDNDPPRRMTTM
ncbi:MAG: hypothetical protein U0670_15400 [Anaerolineae bacterium]